MSLILPINRHRNIKTPEHIHSPAQAGRQTHREQDEQKNKRSPPKIGLQDRFVFLSQDMAEQTHESE